MYENDIESLVRETNSCLSKKLRVPSNSSRKELLLMLFVYSK